MAPSDESKRRAVGRAFLPASFVWTFLAVDTFDRLPHSNRQAGPR
jgi:hypothetical protein